MPILDNSEDSKLPKCEPVVRRILESHHLKIEDLRQSWRMALIIEINYQLEAAMRLGALGERLKARPHEENAARGKKISDGARQGHEQTHGTPEEKRRRYGMYQEEVSQLSLLYPKAKKTDIAHRAARKFKVSYKTILRHTDVPKQHK